MLCLYRNSVGPPSQSSPGACHACVSAQAIMRVSREGRYKSLDRRERRSLLDNLPHRSCATAAARVLTFACHSQRSPHSLQLIFATDNVALTAVRWQCNIPSVWQSLDVVVPSDLGTTGDATIERVIAHGALTSKQRACSVVCSSCRHEAICRQMATQSQAPKCIAYIIALLFSVETADNRSSKTAMKSDYEWWG